MYDTFKREATAGAIHVLEDLLNCELHGQNMKQFINSWEIILESLSHAQVLAGGSQPEAMEKRHRCEQANRHHLHLQFLQRLVCHISN